MNARTTNDASHAMGGGLRRTCRRRMSALRTCAPESAQNVRDGAVVAHGARVEPHFMLTSGTQPA